MKLKIPVTGIADDFLVSESTLRDFAMKWDARVSTIHRYHQRNQYKFNESFRNTYWRV